MSTNTNQEILTKAITKAVANGWDHQLALKGGDLNNPEFHVDPRLYMPGYHQSAVYWLIFNHDFARALWGDSHMGFKEVAVTDYKRDEPIQYPDGILKAWEYHLMQMVIAEDPIAYLGENL